MSIVHSALKQLDELTTRALERSNGEHAKEEVASYVRLSQSGMQVEMRLLAMVVLSPTALVASWMLCTAGFRNALLHAMFALLAGRLTVGVAGLVRYLPWSTSGRSLAKRIALKAAPPM